MDETSSDRPVSDVATSASKTPSTSANCEVCDVVLPNGETSRAIHETGKRHIQMRAQRQAAEELSKLSVFVKIHSEVGNDTVARLNKSGLVAVFKKFGDVKRITCRSDSAYFAFVEFSHEESVKKALTEGSIVCSCEIVDECGKTANVDCKVAILERKISFATSSLGPKQRIDIEQVVATVSHQQIQATGDARFTAEIDAIAQEITLSEVDRQRRLEEVARLQNELAKLVIDPLLELFGSSVTRIGMRDSDMDVCILLPPPSDTPEMITLPSGLRIPSVQRDKQTLLTADTALFRLKRVSASEIRKLNEQERVRFVARLLNEVRKDCGWLAVQHPLVDCRVPLARAVVDKTKIVDFSVDNTIGIAKTTSIRDLCEADSSGCLPKILNALRVWAISNGVFSSCGKNSVNAYTLNLLAISHLRSLGQLPLHRHSEQARYGGSKKKWRIDYSIAPFSLTFSVQEFFKSFFICFTDGGKMQGKVTVTATGEILPKEEFINRHGNDEDFVYSPLCVQDPIELSHNIAASVSLECIRKIRQWMMRSLHSLKKNKNSFISILYLERQLEQQQSIVRPSSAVSADIPLESQKKPDAVLSTSSVHLGAKPEELKTAARLVFQKVLMFSECEHESDDSAPTIKRQKMDTMEATSLLFAVPFRVWIGRRAARRQLSTADLAAASDVLGIEHLVSTKLKSAPLTPEMVVSVEFAFHDTFDIRFFLQKGQPTDLHDLVHFLSGNGLFEKLLPAAYSRLTTNVENERPANSVAEETSGMEVE